MLFFTALVPIALLIVMIGALRTSPVYASLAALASSAAAALIFFRQKPVLIILSALEGGAMALWPIIIVIAAAIFSYNYISETGRMETVKKIILAFSREKSIQVLLLAWGLGNFLEGIAGYGTAVAIPAGIMTALGFNPFYSAVICLLANTVSTALGAVGIPAMTLALMTNLDLSTLTAFIAFQLLPVTLLIPFLLVIVNERSLKKAVKFFPEAAAGSFGFASVNLLAALYLGPQLATILASLSGTVFIIGTSLLRKAFAGKDTPEIPCKSTAVPPGKIFDAVFVYILVLLFIALASPLFPAVRGYLDSFSTEFKFYPESSGKIIRFYWISTPGVLIALAVFFSSILSGDGLSLPFLILIRTAGKLGKTSLTIISLVASATIMRYSGMIEALASGTAEITGSLYPLFSPFVGALGTFLTGSDTSSCILFGEFQKDVALSLGISGYWLASANIAGATAGKMIAPQSIAIAAAAAGIGGREGDLFHYLLPFCFVYLLILGLIIYFFNYSSALFSLFF